MLDHLGPVKRKPVVGFLIRSNTNQAIEPQKMPGCLKFRLRKFDLLLYVYGNS